MEQQVIEGHFSDSSGKFCVQRVYREPHIRIPVGWEYDGFRIPEMGESYIPYSNNRKVWQFTCYGETNWEPRIIVKKEKEKEVKPMYNLTYQKMWTVEEIYGIESPKIPEGFEVVEFRPVQSGEVYLTASGAVATCISSITPVLILTKKKQLFVKLPINHVNTNCDSNFNLAEFEDASGNIRNLRIKKYTQIIEE